MLTFALIWTATGLGTASVAIVSTLAVLPRVLFLLPGGALGDRHGPRATLLVTTSLQLALLITLASLSADKTDLPTLAISACTISIISAFQQPAAAVYPRLLIRSDDQLPRALARMSGSIQLARILGVAAAGITISNYSLMLVFVLAASGSLVNLSTLFISRPEGRFEKSVAQLAPKETIWQSLKTGIAAAYQLGATRLLLSVALVCAAVLPVGSVVVPNIARRHTWNAGQAGVLESAWAAGVLVITLGISYTGTLKAPRNALIAGPLLAALSIGAIGLAPSVPLAALGTFTLGAGTALFTSHVAPLLIVLAPKQQLVRFQSLLTLVQIAPSAALNSIFSILSHGNKWIFALVLAASMSFLAGLLQLFPLRSTPSSD